MKRSIFSGLKRLLPAAPSRRRPRVLYFIVQYPTFSETYMHEEMQAVAGDVDFKIITYRAARFPRRAPFPYEVIRYDDACLVYDPLEKIDRSFGSSTQQLFLERVGEAIERFQPDVLHAHYFGLTLLLEKLAEDHRIPFTVRTHSMDMLSEPPEKIAALCQAANSPWCLRLLAFPAFRNQLIDAGLQPEKVLSCWPVIASSH